MAYRIGASVFDSALSMLIPGYGSGEKAEARGAQHVAEAKALASQQMSKIQQDALEAQLASARGETSKSSQQVADAAKALLGAQTYAASMEKQLREQQLTNAKMQAQAQAQAAKAYYDQLHAQDQAEMLRQRMEMQRHRMEQDFALQQAQQDAAYYAQQQQYQGQPQQYQDQYVDPRHWGHVPGDDDRGVQYGVQLSGCW